MILGTEADPTIHEPEHIQLVISAIRSNFPTYFRTFVERPLPGEFQDAITRYEKEQARYRDYMDLDVLDEFQYDAGAFKRHTRNRCPIIRSCLNSQSEVMAKYQKDFNRTTGRSLLDAVQNIAEFGRDYSAVFNDTQHEAAKLPADLRLERLNEEGMGLGGVIGYGVQSSLLYGIYPRCFAHRSQNAVWSLYFLSGHDDFGMADGNEFTMADPNQGTIAQNYFYPAELFGYYALQVYLMLKAACATQDIHFVDGYRYIYLDLFTDHVADTHREDINIFTQSSTYVESRPWF